MASAMRRAPPRSVRDSASPKALSALCPHDRLRCNGGLTLTRKTTGAKKAPAKSKAKPAAKKSVKKPVTPKTAMKKAAPLPEADGALLDRIKSSLDEDKAE